MGEVTIQSASDIKPRFTLFLWGASKTGKTTFAVTAPGRKLYVCFDPEGFIPIAGRDDVDILRLDDLEVGEACRYGQKSLPTLIEQLEEGKYGTVIVDSISAYAQIALLHAIETSVGKTMKFTPSIEAPGLQAYGARKEYVVALIRNVLKATARKHLHCIFIGHEDDPQLDDDGKFLYQSIMLSQKTVNNVALAISEIWYLRESDGKRYVAVRACRGHKPMGSRIFDMSGEPEFELLYDQDVPDEDQGHTIAAWWNVWEKGGRVKLSLPTKGERRMK